jgi:uncharacterized protein (DUF1330 family)
MMSVLMVAIMHISDKTWMKSYLENVHEILAEHGGRSVARSKDVLRVEGHEGPLPDRVTILSFPSMQAAEAFLADPRYEPYHKQRLSGSTSEILMFENALQQSAGAL